MQLFPKQLKGATGRPKRRITPQKEGESDAQERSGLLLVQAGSCAGNLQGSCTAGKVKGGVSVDISKGYEFDWEEVKAASRVRCACLGCGDECVE